jgi:coproporphyrinogen III oxidase
MIEMYMYILDKVSFDQTLFQKELAKAVKQVNPEEMPAFKTLCIENFNKKYRKELKEIFENNVNSLN